MLQVIFIENEEKYNSVTTLILSLRFVSSIVRNTFFIFFFSGSLELHFGDSSTLINVFSTTKCFQIDEFYLRFVLLQEIENFFKNFFIAEISFVRENNLDVCGILSDLSANHLLVCSPCV